MISRLIGVSRSVSFGIAFCASVASLSACTAVSPSQARATGGYRISQLVPPSPFCGVHGLGVDADDQLFAGSVVGQRLYAVDKNTGAVSVRIGPPLGMADDMEFLADGTLVYTSISQNKVRAQSPEGEVKDLADLVSVNSIARRDDGRLFVAQVFGGDALWELYPNSDKAPRQIIKDMGGLNGFDIGPGGMIYGPLWFKNKVVKINPDTGAMSTVAEGFHTPAATNFDSQWNLFVLDTATGEVFRVHIDTGSKEVFVKLKPALDNLAIDKSDTLYISNMADNSIQAVNGKTREVRTVVEGGLSCASGIAAAGNDLYIADIFALRKVDLSTGRLVDIARSHAATSPIAYASAVAASEQYLYVASSGVWQRYQRASEELINEWPELRGVQALAELPSGNLLAIANRGRNLLRIDPDNIGERQTISSELKGAVAMAIADEQSAYLALKEDNSIAGIDLRSGEIKTIASIQSPVAVALSSNGQLIVLQSNGSVQAIDRYSGEINLIAEHIPVGRLRNDEGIQLPGLAVGVDDSIYVIADAENAIYKITPASGN